ncbi:MAG: alpha/beta hydrolase [Acidimicrobiia bacterium]|nr:alpha/beta hydrolase [Acidimicrobiia bacterium]
MGPKKWCLVITVLAVGVAGCAPFLRPPGVAPMRYRDAIFENVTTTSDVIYGSAVDQQGQTVSLTLDIYEPTGDSVTRRPAVVWVHGGSFASGSKTSPELIDQSVTLAKKGYVNASIEYRLSTGGCSAAAATTSCVTAIQHAMHDAQAAVRFLRANATLYGIDEERIAIGGTSAGAITALNVAFNTEDVGESGNPGYSSFVRAAVSLSGAKILGTANSGEAAIHMFHGTSDGLVPYAWATSTLNEAKAAGVHAYLTTWPNAGHVPYVEHRSEILDQTANFLFWELDLTHAAR